MTMDVIQWADKNVKEVKYINLRHYWNAGPGCWELCEFNQDRRCVSRDDNCDIGRV